jgi:hypothetical protein
MMMGYAFLCCILYVARVGSHSLFLLACWSADIIYTRCLEVQDKPGIKKYSRPLISSFRNNDICLILR